MAMRNECCYALDEVASKDKTVRVVIITGDEAGRAFCAGADLGGGGGKGIIGEDSNDHMPGDAPSGRPTTSHATRPSGKHTFALSFEEQTSDSGDCSRSVH